MSLDVDSTLNDPKWASYGIYSQDCCYPTSSLHIAGLKLNGLHDPLLFFRANDLLGVYAVTITDNKKGSSSTAFVPPHAKIGPDPASPSTGYAVVYFGVYSKTEFPLFRFAFPNQLTLTRRIPKCCMRFGEKEFSAAPSFMNSLNRLAACGISFQSVCFSHGTNTAPDLSAFLPATDSTGTPALLSGIGIQHGGLQDEYDKLIESDASSALAPIVVAVPEYLEEPETWTGRSTLFTNRFCFSFDAHVVDLSTMGLAVVYDNAGAVGIGHHSIMHYCHPACSPGSCGVSAPTPYRFLKFSKWKVAESHFKLHCFSQRASGLFSMVLITIWSKHAHYSILSLRWRATSWMSDCCEILTNFCFARRNLDMRLLASRSEFCAHFASCFTNLLPLSPTTSRMTK